MRHDFGADTNRYPRPDDSVNRKYASVRPVWSIETGYTIASSPAVWKDLAIVGDASGAVRGLDLQTGRLKWTFQAGNAVFSTPAVARDLVVFAAADGKVHALNPRTGASVWTFATDRPIVASPAISGNRVFIGSSEGKFRALNLQSGKLLWEWSGANNFIETRPLVYDDKVIFGAWDEHLYALDARTGRLSWKWRGDRPGALLSPAACWPVAALGKIFIVAPDRKMTAIDAKTGDTLWRTGDWVVRESIGISADGRRIFARAMNDFFYAFDTAADQPSRLWETNAAFGYDINSAMLVETDGIVFYGTKNGLLFALDEDDGSILWQHKFGNGILNTVTPLSGRRLLVSNFDGQVALIENRSR
jgi:outer membrane protein assembly factor BamB